MKLYFGNMVTTVTTLMILSLVGFVVYSISSRSNINYWGRRSLFVLVYGLVICCFAAANGGLNYSSLSRLAKPSMRKTGQPRQSSICRRTDHEQTYQKESGKKATD